MQWQSNLNQHLWKKSRVLASAQHFFKSLITRTRFVQQTAYGAKNLFYTFHPIMQKGSLSHFFGEIMARRISRRFNEISLQALIKKKHFSYIFHAENMMLSPILSKTIPSFFDAQDDFDEAHEELDLLRYEKQFLGQNVRFCKKNFAITEATASHFKQLTKCDFEVLPNGADFESFQQILPESVASLKKDLNLSKKFIVSYIGGDVWLDKPFLESLASLAYKVDPSIHLLLVGKLPLINASPNITQLGFVDPAKIHKYYCLSDAGFLPKDSDNLFLKNSHPLKIIQYSASKKPVITPIMGESSLFRYDNIFQTEFNAQAWVNRILQLKTFKWSEKLTVEWSVYSWENLGRKLAETLKQ